MTKHFYGSSLFQARKTDHHRHSHLHDRRFHNAHARSHAEFHKLLEETAELDPRDTITEIVQTVSVVQIIDGSGATLSIQTVNGNSQTDLVDAETGSTLDVNVKAASTTSTDVAATTTTDATPTETAVSSADPVAASTDSTISPTDTTDASTSSPTEDVSTSVTSLSITLPTSSSFSSITASNSTTLSLSSDISSVLFSSTSTNTSETASTFFGTSASSASDALASASDDSSISSTLVSSTTLASSIASSTSDSLSTTATSPGDVSSTTDFSSTATASSAFGAGDDGGSGTATASAVPSSTSGSFESGGGGSSSTRTNQVVGGVFGGLAGIALIAAVAFMVIRMRKRGWCHLRLSGDDASGPASGPASKALGPHPAPGDDGNNSSAYGTMQQRSAPQAVAASLAALAGKRTSRERAGSGTGMAERGEGGERGFVRVSGKKLPPVLQYGGDGYSDPRGERDSQLSDSSVYRDSMAIFDQQNHTRLALGSPMRPESGIMTMHPGPAKTPVTTTAPPHVDSPTLPKSQTFPSVSPEPSSDAIGRALAGQDHSHDAVGRTLATQDYSRDGSHSRASHTSRGSGRFTEHVA